MDDGTRVLHLNNIVYDTMLQFQVPLQTIWVKGIFLHTNSSSSGLGNPWVRPTLKNAFSFSEKGFSTRLPESCRELGISTSHKLL